MDNSSNFLDAVFSLNPGPDHCLYALVDHAGAPGLVKRLHDYPTTPWINLFYGSREEMAIEAAPLLLTLQPPLMACWLPWLHTACRESTSLTLLYSAADPQILANGLKRRLDVILPDEVPAMLRYFDTRILEPLLQVLEPLQRTSFLGIASRWLWLDRGGNLQAHDAVAASEDSWPSHFVFSQQQQNLMIEASEADTLVQQMQVYGWDLCESHSRAELHAIAGSALSSAREFGIEEMPSQTLFGLTCLHAGPNFMHEPEYMAMLDRVQKEEITFEEAIKQKGL